MVYFAMPTRFSKFSNFFRTTLYRLVLLRAATPRVPINRESGSQLLSARVVITVLQFFCLTLSSVKLSLYDVFIFFAPTYCCLRVLKLSRYVVHVCFCVFLQQREVDIWSQAQSSTDTLGTTVYKTSTHLRTHRHA